MTTGIGWKKSVCAMPSAPWERRTQTEVAQEIGISQAQVSRLEKSALERIKGQMRED